MARTPEVIKRELKHVRDQIIQASFSNVDLDKLQKGEARLEAELKARLQAEVPRTTLDSQLSKLTRKEIGERINQLQQKLRELQPQDKSYQDTKRSWKHCGRRTGGS